MSTLTHSSFGPGTDRVSLHVLFFVLFFLLGRCSSKKAEGSAVSNRIGMKFDCVVAQVNTHRWTESDFCYDVILSRLVATTFARRLLFHYAIPPSACDVIGSLYVPDPYSYLFQLRRALPDYWPNLACKIVETHLGLNSVRLCSRKRVQQLKNT